MSRESSMGASVVESMMKVQYGIVRKKGKKRITIHVDQEADVVVTVPFHVTKTQIDRFVASHTDWIVAKQTYIHSLPGPLAPHTYGPGDRHLFFDQEKILEVVTLPRGIPSSTRIQGEELTVSLWKPTPARIKRAILEFYSGSGQDYYRKAVAKWVVLLGLPEEKYPVSISMVNYAARMGCCSKNRELRFALRSLMLPEPLLDYLALHETAHLVEFNHGDGFKKLIARYMPDWKFRQKEIARLRNRAVRL
ncbi:MAG: M48 family metallopeptidase [Sphaerochaetaceae bacterium]